MDAFLDYRHSHFLYSVEAKIRNSTRTNRQGFVYLCCDFSAYCNADTGADFKHTLGSVAVNPARMALMRLWLTPCLPMQILGSPIVN